MTPAHDEPFGRQPLPVTIRIEGDPADVSYWFRRLIRASESSGDLTQKLDDNSFRIFPRTVND